MNQKKTIKVIIFIWAASMTMSMSSIANNATNNIINEMFSTEKSYNKSLKDLRLLYLDRIMNPMPFPTNDRDKLAPLLAARINDLIVPIINLSDKYIEALNNANQATDKVKTVAEMFISNAAALKRIYIAYAARFSEFKKELNNEKIQKNQFVQKVTDEFRKKLAKWPDDIFIMPIQRIPRYELLLKDLLNNNKDNDLVKEAFSIIKTVADSIDKSIPK